MRLWSIHPSYLDSKGLVALWREGLLALHVLTGQTKGYTHHPQLVRFRQHDDPIAAITFYLHLVVDEAESRQFSFDRSKLAPRMPVDPIPVTHGQMAYESEHLKKKLLVRDESRLQTMAALSALKPHPLFTVIPGERESWEKVSSATIQISRER